MWYVCGNMSTIAARLDPVAPADQGAQVARVRGRLARDVDEPVRAEADDLGQGGGLAAGPRRIQDHAAVPSDSHLPQGGLDLARACTPPAPS